MYGEVMGGKNEGGNPHANYTWIGCGFLPAFPGLTDTATGAVRKHWSSFNSDHPMGIMQFVLADGAVRGVNPQMDYGVYIALSGMADGMQTKTDVLN